MSSLKTFSPRSSSSHKFPLWAQLSLGLGLVFMVYWVGIRSNSYLSDWTEEDSNFYESALGALNHLSINPTAPTAIIFWKTDCETCRKSIQFLSRSPGQLRIYGIHLSERESSEFEIRKTWYQDSPRSANLLIDQNELLQTSFKVKSVPETFIILPKQKRIWNYYGNLERGEKEMLKIISSE